MGAKHDPTCKLQHAMDSRQYRCTNSQLCNVQRERRVCVLSVPVFCMLYGIKLYTSTVLRGTEIGTATPTSHRPSGFSSLTADAVMRVATSAGANREFAVRHPHQWPLPVPPPESPRHAEKHVFGPYWATRDASHLPVRADRCYGHPCMSWACRAGADRDVWVRRSRRRGG